MQYPSDYPLGQSAEYNLYADDQAHYGAGSPVAYDGPNDDGTPEIGHLVTVAVDGTAHILPGGDKANIHLAKFVRQYGCGIQGENIHLMVRAAGEWAYIRDAHCPSEEQCSHEEQATRLRLAWANLNRAHDEAIQASYFSNHGHAAWTYLRAAKLEMRSLANTLGVDL